MLKKVLMGVALAFMLVACGGKDYVDLSNEDKTKHQEALNKLSQELNQGDLKFYSIESLKDTHPWFANELMKKNLKGSNFYVLVVDKNNLEYLYRVYYPNNGKDLSNFKLQNHSDELVINKGK